jgi:hypothetical protein
MINNCKSLREVTQGIAAYGDKLNHLGITYTPPLMIHYLIVLFSCKFGINRINYIFKYFNYGLLISKTVFGGISLYCSSFPVKCLNILNNIDTALLKMEIMY